MIIKLLGKGEKDLGLLCYTFVDKICKIHWL